MARPKKVDGVLNEETTQNKTVETTETANQEAKPAKKEKAVEEASELAKQVGARPSVMTVKEVTEHREAGHVIGAPSQRLVTEHDMEDLKPWEMWALELKLKAEFRNGKEVSVPFEAQAVKLLKSNVRVSQKTIMEQNHIVDFRLIASPNYSNYYLPAGKVKAGQVIKCGLYGQTVGKGVDERVIDRILFEGFEEATKA